MRSQGYLADRAILHTAMSDGPTASYVVEGRVRRAGCGGDHQAGELARSAGAAVRCRSSRSPASGLLHRKIARLLDEPVICDQVEV